MQKKTGKTLKDLKRSVKNLSNQKLSDSIMDLIWAIVKHRIRPNRVRKCLKEAECSPKVKDALTSLSMIVRDHGCPEAKSSLPESIQINLP